MGSLCVLFLYIIFEILKIKFEKWCLMTLGSHLARKTAILNVCV